MPLFKFLISNYWWLQSEIEGRYIGAITFDLEEEDLDEDENFSLTVKNKKGTSEFLITLDSSSRCKPTQEEVGEGCSSSSYTCDLDDDKDCRCNRRKTECCDASRRCKENCCFGIHVPTRGLISLVVSCSGCWWHFRQLGWQPRQWGWHNWCRSEWRWDLWTTSRGVLEASAGSAVERWTVRNPAWLDPHPPPARRPHKSRVHQQNFENAWNLGSHKALPLHALLC